MNRYVKSPKEPIELFIFRDGEYIPLEHHVCGECHMIKHSKQFAYDCCRQFICGTCGNNCNQFQTSCWDCIEKSKMDKCEEISPKDFDGPVYDSASERWFESYDDAVDHFSDKEPSDRPEFLEPCESHSIRLLDATDVLESYTEDMFEDAYDHLCGVEDFEEAVKKFNEANRHIKQWDTIPNKKIRLVVEVSNEP